MGTLKNSHSAFASQRQLSRCNAAHVKRPLRSGIFEVTFSLVIACSHIIAGDQAMARSLAPRFPLSPATPLIDLWGYQGVWKLPTGDWGIALGNASRPDLQSRCLGE